MKFTIDIEPTNRCNAKCGFCPRDRTPHQGLMEADVFTQSLARSVEFRGQVTQLFDAEVSVSLCGLGEPLLNKATPSFVQQVRDAGFHCAMSSNASLLDEAAGQRLLDAGLQTIFINAGDLDDEYEDVYKLPFETTRANIERFRQMAGDQCEVFVILVNHRDDRKYVKEVREYWRSLGIERFQRHDIMNRGGSLQIDGFDQTTRGQMKPALELIEERGIDPICGVAFVNLFIGYDGQYYLCCSDWEKRVPLGSVFDESFGSITREKLEHVTTRRPICATCSHDPQNNLAEHLADVAGGDVEESETESVLQSMVVGGESVRRLVDGMLADGEAPVGAGREQ